MQSAFGQGKGQTAKAQRIVQCCDDVSNTALQVDRKCAILCIIFRFRQSTVTTLNHPFSTFCIAFYIFVVGVDFGRQVNRRKS